MSNPRATSSLAKSSDQPTANARSQGDGKSNKQRDPPNSDRKPKPAERAKDHCDERAPTQASGNRQSKKQTDKCESQDKPTTSKSDENPASQRANGQSKKRKDLSNSDKDKPPHPSESKSADQRAPRSTTAHKSGASTTMNTGGTQAPENDAQESAMQTDPAKCQSRDTSQKTAKSKQAENSAPKRATGNRQSKKEKENSLVKRDDSPHTCDSKSTEQRAPKSRGAHETGPNTTDSLGEAQGTKTDAQDAKSGRKNKKQTDLHNGQSQDRPDTIRSDSNPAPKRESKKQKDQSRDDEPPQLSRSESMGSSKPTKTSSAPIKTDSVGQEQTIGHFRHPIPDQLQNVLHATIEKLKIKKAERSAASSCVNEITDTVISHLKKSLNWCADIEELRTGSYYENVKISEPDEFDVMLTVPVERVDIQNFHDKEAFYSVALKRHPTKHYLAKFLHDDKTIKANKMLTEFRDGVKEAVNSLPYQTVVQRKKQRSPAVTLQVTQNEKEISLDFVLGLKVRGSWPHNTQDGFKIERWLGTKVKAELKRQPYYLVPKFEGKGNAEHDGVIAKNAWRISFSHVEKDILKKHGNSKTCCEANGQKCCRKECLKLLKYLLSRLKEVHSEKMSKFYSYHAKTTLLHACVERVEDDKWAYSQLADCFQQLLKDFVRFLKTQDLPNFFVPSHNLLNPDNVPKSSCDFLATQIELQRNKNFPLFQ